LRELGSAKYVAKVKGTQFCATMSELPQNVLKYEMLSVIRPLLARSCSPTTVPQKLVGHGRDVNPTEEVGSWGGGVASGQFCTVEITPKGCAGLVAGDDGTYWKCFPLDERKPFEAETLPDLIPSMQEKFGKGF